MMVNPDEPHNWRAPRHSRSTRVTMSHNTWKTIAVFAFVAFCMDFTGGMMGVALPFMAMSFGAGSLMLGIMGASRSLAYAGLAAPFGHLSDKGYRKLLAIISAVAMGVTLAAMGVTQALWQLFAVSILWIVFYAIFWPSIWGWIADAHPGKSLGRSMGAANLGWSLGNMMGAFAAGALFKQSNWLPFMVAAAAPMVACVVLSRLPAPKPHPATAHSSVHTPVRWLAAVWIGNFVVMWFFGLMVDVFPRLGKTLGITSAEFGAFVSLLGLVRTGAFVVGAFRSHVLLDWRLCLGAQAVLAVMVATVTSASTHWWLACVFAALGLGIGMTYYGGVYLSVAAGSGKAFKTGLVEASAVSGQLLGSLAGGIIAEAAGIRAPYLPMAIVGGGLILAQLALVMTSRQPHPSSALNGDTA
jgi:MFS family permease